MKKISFFLMLFSCALLSCTSENSSKNLDLDEIAEVLYVTKSKLNTLSSLSEPQVTYVSYVNFDVEHFIDYADSNIPSVDFIQMHIYYKHMYQIVIRLKDGVPFITIETISYYQNVAKYNRKNLDYLDRVFRELNSKFAKMQKQSRTLESFTYDDFVFELRLEQGCNFLDYECLSFDGNSLECEYTEENRIKRAISSHIARIKEYEDSLKSYELELGLKEQFLHNAEIYTKYQKLLAEHNQKRKLIMTPYNSKPYYDIKKVIDETPDIVANSAQYTEGNLSTIKREVESIKISLQRCNNYLEQEKEKLSFLHSRLDCLNK